MNLFRKHKSFEDQLREQLGDSEYKPSESLWDRIDSGMSRDGFESGVQQSLENFEQVPYPETWEKIAAELPEERRGNRFLKYYGIALIALVLLAGIYIGRRSGAEQEEQQGTPAASERSVALNREVDAYIIHESPVAPESAGQLSTKVKAQANGDEENERLSYTEGTRAVAKNNSFEDQSVNASTLHKASAVRPDQQQTYIKDGANPRTDQNAQAVGHSTIDPETVKSRQLVVAAAPAKQPVHTKPAKEKQQRKQPTQHKAETNATATVAHRQADQHVSAAKQDQRTSDASDQKDEQTRLTIGGQHSKTGVVSSAKRPVKLSGALMGSGAKRPASRTGKPAPQQDQQATLADAAGRRAAQHQQQAIAGTALSAKAQDQDKAGTSQHADQSSAETSNLAVPGQAPHHTPSENGQQGLDSSSAPAAVKAEQPKPVEVIPPVQEDVRVLTEAKPDSSVHYEEPEGEKLSPVSISILSGINMCFSTYQAPDNYATAFEKNIALRKKLERPDIDWSGGFLLDVRLSERWMISGGVIITNFSQKFDYNTMPAVDPGTNEPDGSVQNPNDSVVAGNGFANRIKYTWTEVPLFISYSPVNSRRLNIGIQAGISYAFINTVNAAIISYDNKGVLVLRDKEAFPQISNAIFVTFLPQASFKFNEQVSLGVVPSFKYSLTSIIGNERWVQQHPYFMGLNLCLRKRF